MRRDLKLDVLDELWAGATMSEAECVRARRGGATRDEASPTGISCARSLMSTS